MEELSTIAITQAPYDGSSLSLSLPTMKQSTNNKPPSLSALKHKRRFCKVPTCTKIVKSQGLCQRHGARSTKCKVPGCPKQAQGNHNGMCKAHDRQVKQQQQQGSTNGPIAPMTAPAIEWSQSINEETHYIAVPVQEKNEMDVTATMDGLVHHMHHNENQEGHLSSTTTREQTKTDATASCLSKVTALMGPPVLPSIHHHYHHPMDNTSNIVSPTLLTETRHDLETKALPSVPCLPFGSHHKRCDSSASSTTGWADPLYFFQHMPCTTNNDRHHHERHPSADISLDSRFWMPDGATCGDYRDNNNIKATPCYHHGEPTRTTMTRSRVLLDHYDHGATSSSTTAKTHSMML